MACEKGEAWKDGNFYGKQKLFLKRGKGGGNGEAGKVCSKKNPGREKTGGGALLTWGKPPLGFKK